MKQYSKKLFSLVVLFSTATVMLHANSGSNDSGRVSPFLQWRSEGRDTARKLYGTTSYAVYQDDMDSIYGTFNATLQYDQSFRGKRIAECLFGDSLVSSTAANNCSDACGEAIVISGLLTREGEFNTARGAKDWMAENFYLPRDFNSVLTFSPKVTNVLVDFDLYVGLDKWVKGMYFRLYGPVVHNKSGLHVKENVIFAGDAEGDYPQGYFNPADDVASTALFNNALSFFGGCTPTAITGLTLQPLCFAKLANCNIPSTTTNGCSDDCNDPCGSSTHKKTGFAELRGEFGWNYIQDKYRLLINVQAAAPTGSRPNAVYALEAQVGNGKHWELGVGLGGAWKMWENEDKDKSFNFIVEADITHLFAAKQTRTFDLKNKPNSRYMLAQKMEPITAATALPHLDGASNAGFQFANEYAPVANITTQNVKVSIGAQGDVVAMFNYTVRGFSWDLGYNFWGMSTSEIKCFDSCDDSCNNSCSNVCSNGCSVVPFLANTWALKGDAEIAGTPTTQTVGGQIVRLAATESKATIFAGTNGATYITGPTANVNVDNATQATYITNVGTPTTGTLDSFFSGNLIDTSVAPIFISASDFDYEGAETRGLSHKVFTHFSYTWNTNNDKRYLPYLGAGFSAQFGSHSGGDDDCPATVTTNNCDDDNSLSCALSNWAVFVKGGVSFH
jgi:hypothetical protein